MAEDEEGDGGAVHADVESDEVRMASVIICNGARNAEDEEGEDERWVAGLVMQRKGDEGEGESVGRWEKGGVCRDFVKIFFCNFLSCLDFLVER